jgi:hypothetical protein
MDADLDLLLTAVYVTADDLLPERVTSLVLVWERFGRKVPATVALMIVGLLEGSTKGGQRWPAGTG